MHSSEVRALGFKTRSIMRCFRWEREPKTSRGRTCESAWGRLSEGQGDESLERDEQRRWQLSAVDLQSWDSLQHYTPKPTTAEHACSFIILSFAVTFAFVVMKSTDYMIEINSITSHKSLGFSEGILYIMNMSPSVMFLEGSWNLNIDAFMAYNWQLLCLK